MRGGKNFFERWLLCSRLVGEAPLAIGAPEPEHPGLYRDPEVATHDEPMTRFDASGRGHKAAGTSDGGQFDGRVRRNPADSGTTLSSNRPSSTGALTDRASSAQARFLHRAELIEQGYAPAVFTASKTRVQTTDGIKDWWSEHFVNAEHGSKSADGATYPVIPDDYTPKETLGRAMSGKRRTHRIKYEADGYAIRMPSATAIKRFAAESESRTFDVPVQAVRILPDGRESTTTGYVRVTRHGPSSWTAEPLGLNEQQGSVIGESVSTILEARHPSIALKQAGNLYQKYQERKSRQGKALEPLKRPSSFVNGAAYDEQHNEIYVQLGERKYGYSFPQASAAYRGLQVSHSPGKWYNEMIKKHAGGHFEVTTCGKCGNTYRADRKHACPAHHDATTTVKPHRQRIAARIVAGAKRLREQEQARLDAAQKAAAPQAPAS